MYDTATTRMETMREETEHRKMIHGGQHTEDGGQEDNMIVT
jgi:hypothetical protein